MKFPHLTSEELLTFAHRHRAIGVHEQRWTIARNHEDLFQLISTSGPRYLYRGQAKRYRPCFPTIYRHLKAPARYLWDVSQGDAAKIAADIVRTFWYYAELNKHPVFRWAKTEGLYLPLPELAQHYGIATPLLDLSEAIEVALFFATHQFKDGAFEPCTSGTGVLYMIDRTTMPPEFASRFTSVAIQPFPRPFRQWAWTCELFMGECFEAYPWLGGLEFEHSEALANSIRSMAEAAGPLFPPDALANIAEAINASQSLPAESVEAATKHLEFAFPKEFGTVHDALAAAGYSISPSVPAVTTDALTAELEPLCTTTVEAWKAFASDRVEQIYVRGGHDGARLEYGVLTPPATEGGTWSIVPAARYFSATDNARKKSLAAAPDVDD